jgi:putative membrane-bound dehydrogenase-like protein
MKRFLPLIPLIIFNSCSRQQVEPGRVINLMEDPSFQNFTYHLWPERSLTDKREEIWNINEAGVLNVSGKGWGYIRTKEKHHDYHLVMEYKWGEHTVGYRADRARDNGLLIHASGEDGAYSKSWMSSIEAQLIEGGSGDILVLAATDDQGVKAPTKATAMVRPARDGETVWFPGGEARTFPPPEKKSSRIYWNERDPYWKDVRGFRGEKDIENPVGEWNRLEVICREATIQIFLNGEQVNEVNDVYPSEGFICLQSEGAEVWVRRFELWPLDEFKESWKPVIASTDTGISETGDSILPRRFPLSPEQSQEAWQIDGDYEIELVAAEPIVRDPVDVVWDENGQMFVAEMGDYPLPTETGPLMSRIRVLSDEDGDGRMDKATTWADHLDHVQGMVPMNGGLLITTRTAILFLKDSNGDGVADEQRSLFTSNEPRHNQLQVSSPRWGLDNTIYLNNGLEGMEIYPSDSPAEAMAFRGRDLRYDPRKNQISVTTGRGQFGASFDDWGRRFFSTNRNPIIFPVMSVEALERNPAAALTLGYEDIQPQASPVYPIRISHTTSFAHLGTHTAACGLGVYRGHLMPELTGNIFVCEPTGQLVTRNRLVPNGASFKAERVGDKRDFLASSDEWTRPVQIRNGPDGALYICDMYRRFIDHSKFFPEEFLRTNYMRAGLDHGRIWRLVPKGVNSPKVESLPESNSELVKLLESKIGWQRIHSQRLLIERKAEEVISEIKKILEYSSSPQGRLHALWTLQGMGVLTDEQIATALNDSESGVVENAVRLANPETHSQQLIKHAASGTSRVSFLATLALGSPTVNPSTSMEAFLKVLKNDGLADPWIRKAVLSAADPPTAELLAAILNEAKGQNSLSGGSTKDLGDFLREFSAEMAARGDLKGLRLIAAQVVPGKPRPSDAPLVEGLSQGLKRSSLSTTSIAAFLIEPPAPITQNNLAGIQATIDSAASIAGNRNLDIEERLMALSLVQELGKDTLFSVARQLIHQTEPPEIQSMACRMLSRLNRQEVAQFYFDQWNTLGPIPLREALETIAANEDTALQLMKRMQKGEINPSVMPAFHRWRLGRRENKEIANLARELFGTIDEDRAGVIAEYASAVGNQAGDPKRGRLVFEKAACSTCHRVGDLGVEVGPTLADVRFKLRDALLSDILDPNRAVEERWALYSVETKDGLSFSGLIASETSTALEIKVAGGHSEIIPRDQLTKLETNGLSLMPVGLEGVVDKTDMADLIAFLTNQ